MSDIRPLTFGETLDRTFSLYRANLLLFAGIAAVPSLAVIPLSLITRWFQRDMAGTPAPEQILASFGALMLGLLVYYAIHMVGMAGTVAAVSEIYLGRETTVGASYDRVVPRLGGLFNIYISVLIRMLGWAITIILSPVAYLLFLWYAFAVPVMLLENETAKVALKRSRMLTKGQRDRIFLMYLLMGLIGAVIVYVAQAPFIFLHYAIVPKGQVLGPLWLDLLMYCAAAGAGAFTSPPAMIAMTLLYYNTRVVREGFDLQSALLERLDQAPAPDLA